MSDIDILKKAVENERAYDKLEQLAEEAVADSEVFTFDNSGKPFHGLMIREWERGFKVGELVPIKGLWFRVTGVVREKEPIGALVLEPTGERTGPRVREKEPIGALVLEPTGERTGPRGVMKP